MIDKKQITGIILSGGKSSRMGTDKGFLMYAGKSFIEHSIEALRSLVSNIIIVSNNEEYDVFGLKRIYSGLKFSSTAYNLVLSCDIPLIKTQILERLINAIDVDAQVIQIESDGKSMPLIALYKKSCEHTFLKLLNDGERRLQFAVNKCHVKNVVLNKEEELFTQNINTQKELKAII